VTIAAVSKFQRHIEADKMANILLDNIINETVRKTLGSHDLLEDSFLRHLQGTNLVSKNGNFAAPIDDKISDANKSSYTDDIQLATSSTNATVEAQLDNLTKSIQNVEMSQEERVFWVLVFSIMVLVAAGGNTIVVYIVSTNKEMKSVTNYFLVNLSLADTMVSTLNVIFNFISMLIR